jgi:cbb3-type cytochrome c oxidase subunit III
MNMKNWLIAVAGVLTLAILLIVRPSPSFQAEEGRVLIANGEALFTELCAGCHGEDGKGEGVLIATSLNNPQYLSTFSNEEIHKSISEGKQQTMMPGFSFLGDQKIGEVVSFIRSWQKKPLVLEVPNLLDGNADNGKQLYQLYCVTCHGDTGSGMLTKAAAIANPATLENLSREQMWISAAYGREGTRMGPSLEGQAGVRQLKKQDLNDILAYIREDLAGAYDPREHTHRAHELKSQSSMDKQQ